MSSTLKLLIAGWKSISLIDVHGYSSFTLWTCGCNLKCPFCHNWRIANRDSTICKYVDITDLVEEVLISKPLITYLHVTGGEPLLQWQGLMKLFEKTRSEVLNSLNSNLTFYEPLRKLLERDLLHHVAVDLKIPPEELYGVPSSSVTILWKLFLKSLELLRKYNVQVELRIPVYRGLSREVLVFYFNQVCGLIDPDRTVVILNQILGEPVVEPRDKGWCLEKCFPPEPLLAELADAIKSYGFSRVYVKSILGYSQ